MCWCRGKSVSARVTSDGIKNDNGGWTGGDTGDRCDAVSGSLVCNGLWIWWSALVLHVGRQRGDKNPVSQCIAAAVATTAAAAAAAVTGGVVRQAGGASGWQRVGFWLVPSFVSR